MKGINYLLATMICLSCTLSNAAVIDDYAAVTNDRFANSLSFIGADQDWSGIGMTPGGKWATLVGPNTVVSAYHLRPSGKVMFYPGNDSTADPVDIRITEGQRIPGTDLWLGCLEAFVPSSITPFKFATADLTSGSFASSLLASADVYMAGRSPSPYPAQVDQAIGTNRITSYIEDANAGLGDNVDTLRMVYDAAQASGSTTEYREFETHFEIGDSGAPVFSEIDGELVLVGIGSYITTSGQGQVTGSHASYVGNESDEIEGFVDMCIAAGPEPASGSALYLAFLGLLAGRARRRG